MQKVEKGKPFLLFQALTGNFLDPSRRIFRTKREALKHIKKMVREREAWVTNEHVLKSYEINRIHINEIPAWSRIFTVHKRRFKGS